MTNPFPIKNIKQVTHIGQLDIQQKRPNSLEGAGLSVSQHPDAWQQIARLGGNPWHELTKKTAAFLDFHALSETHREQITQWGVLNGYLEPATIYYHTWFDEYESERTFESTDYIQVQIEIEEEGQTVQEKPGFKALPELERVTLHHNIPPFLALGLLTTIFAEQVLELDGVWWDDVLDPYGYSAPRGVIHVNSLPSWTVRQLK